MDCKLMSLETSFNFSDFSILEQRTYAIYIQCCLSWLNWPKKLHKINLCDAISICKYLLIQRSKLFTRYAHITTLSNIKLQLVVYLRNLAQWSGKQFFSFLFHSVSLLSYLSTTVDKLVLITLPNEKQKEAKEVSEN